MKERLGSIALPLTCYVFPGKSFNILYFTGQMRLWVYSPFLSLQIENALKRHTSPGECQLVFYQSTQVCFASGCPISPIPSLLQSQLLAGICGGQIHLLPPHLLSIVSIFVIYIEFYKPWRQAIAKQSNLSCSPRLCRYSHIFQEHLSSIE